MTGSNGQDWAVYQPDAPTTAGLSFAFVKATEGLTYTNPRYAAQVAHGRAAGLVMGHYHYPHMANSPGAEADYFLSVAKPQPGDVLSLDWEGYDAANKGVPWSRQVAYKAAFLVRLEAVAPLHQHLVYCSVDYLNRDPNGTYGDGLWIATGGKPAGQPGIAHSWLIHQYSTAGNVDHDYSPLTPAQLKTWAHAKETDMPLTQDEISRIAEAVWLVRKDSPTAPKGTNASRLTGDFLRWGDQHAADVLAAVKAQPTPALTADQVTAVAAQLAASPALAAAIAKQVAEQLAARLQS